MRDLRAEARAFMPEDLFTLLRLLRDAQNPISAASAEIELLVDQKLAFCAAVQKRLGVIHS
jgi:hypothetical protein